MAQPYMGEIRLFAGTFAIYGWSFCNGAAMSVAQNDALFSLLGTTYGGDGVNTFNLPAPTRPCAGAPGTRCGTQQLRTGPESRGRECDTHCRPTANPFTRRNGQRHGRGDIQSFERNLGKQRDR